MEDRRDGGRDHGRADRSHLGGIIDPAAGISLLPILREICDRHNVLLIFDEIITGIGRTGRMFAAETFGVTPDVLCTAKGLSGGYAPLSAMICRRGIADAFWGPIAENPGFVEGHTFEGNPMAQCAAAASRCCREIHGSPAAICVPQCAITQGERLRRGFELRWRQKYGVIGDIRGKGLLQGIEFSAPTCQRKRHFRRRPWRSASSRVGRRALSERACLCRFDPHWLAFGPPLIVTSEQIDEMLAILDKSLGEVLESLR